jgi:ArsR family transcriptional regulator
VSAAQFHRVAKALSEPRRFEILEMIAVNPELSCGEIVEQFTVSQATISHHIKELINAGLAESRREGQYCYYRICPDVLAEYITELQRLVTVSTAKQQARDLI